VTRAMCTSRAGAGGEPAARPTTPAWRPKTGTGPRGRVAHRTYPAAVVLMIALCATALASCGGTRAAGRNPTTSESVPAYVTAPETRQQHLVAEGARLAVADGCAACHLSSSSSRLGPNFYGFAGHRVTLTNGAVVVVDEAFIRRALTHPGAYAISGYDPRAMPAALRRLGVELPAHPRDVAALAAFVEQVGPES